MTRRVPGVAYPTPFDQLPRAILPAAPVVRAKRSRFCWLSTLTSLRVCKSIAQAVALGKPGDLICAHDVEANAPAARASHKIALTRSGRKIAVKVSR